MRDEWVEAGESLVKAVGVAAWVAVPDYAASRWGRVALRVGIMAAVVGASIAGGRLRGEETAAEADAEGQEAVGVSLVERLGTAKAAGVLALGVAGAVGSNVVGRRVMRGTAGWLDRRGVRRPWSVIGAGAGVLTLAGDVDKLRAAVARASS